MPDPIAYLNGAWVSRDALHVDVNDVGFLMGATVSERLRTYAGKVFRLEEHLQRLGRSLEWLQLDGAARRAELAQVIPELVRHNHQLLEPEDDLAVVLFITPRPTCCAYTLPIPFGQYGALYAAGQPLTTSRWRQVPPSSWPPGLKCRSRIHYYLADAEARASDSDSRAVLLDQRGYVAEASTANVVMTRDGSVVSPRLDYILPGVSLAVMEELCNHLGVAMEYRDIRPPELQRAEEVLLCSTTPFVLPVRAIDGQPIAASPGPTFERLIVAFSDLVGIDIRAQALKFKDRVD